MKDILKEILDTSNLGNQTNDNKLVLEKKDNTIECKIINESKNLSHIIVEINKKNNVTIIRPINTIIESYYYFEPKYDIKEFIFEDLEIEIDELDSGGYGVYGLPEGFTKTIAYGLGLEKKYKILLNTIQKYCKDCQKIRISEGNKTSLNSNELIINHSDFDKIRRGLDRNQELFYREGQIAKESFIHDNIFTYIDSEKFPNLKIPSRKDVIYKVLRNTDYSKITNGDKNTLSQLKDTTDLSYLTVLMNEFEEKIKGNHQESAYQLFFEQNPLLLTFFSGSPFVTFKNQAYVGGKSFDNSNGQYPDFLHKNKLTNNTFIIEIKTPTTSLLDKTPYRNTGVYNPSKNLSGSITQLLTQKYQLETDISNLIKNAEDRNIEAYNVQSLLIIGNLSTLKSKDMIRSFELFRNNQSNLRIMTYDECLELLKTFTSLLSKNIDIVED
ncbi:DUF4263 domain-containing protein [Flavobacterium columnare]|uniref:DUF4263 domain-containing protein n=1 Tax=Flavobacterium columnare TaxID=996 RepID=A0A437UEC4_9FLAO|nr:MULTISPECIES: Shedu immune nuclease family protein [Flavobacterium]QYS88557.1 DUF4263 domain-containing protein [Flavobacterium davisii]RVU91994.1 DUF4263 domain-containing protein [Flavobacterium columnare]